MLNLNCVICTELFNSSDDVRVTTCGHIFHFTCLRQWMNRSKSCPQCRNECTDRTIFRIYFNLANTDASHIDVGSLQEQLDDAKLQIKVKEKGLKQSMRKNKRLTKRQQICTKTISSLEQKLKESDFLILTYSEQMQLLEEDAKVAKTVCNEFELLKQQIKQMETVSSVVDTLKRELRNCESKKADLGKVLRQTQDNLRKEADIRKTHEERISQLEGEKYQLRQKMQNLVITSWNDIELLEQGIQPVETVVDTLKSELSNYESENDYLRKIFEGAQDNLRQEADMRKTCEERISQLENENYQLRQKLRALEAEHAEDIHCIKMFIIFVIVVACSTLYLYAVYKAK